MFFFPQCPPKWTTLQAVISLGQNPLPAKVRIKAHPMKGEEFYNVDQWKWYTEGMAKKDYQDPVQIQVRKLLNRGLVMTFALFKFKYDPLICKYMPELPMPHDPAFVEVIEIVKKCQGNCVLEMNAEITRVKDEAIAMYKKDVGGQIHPNLCTDFMWLHSQTLAQCNMYIPSL